MFKRRKPLSKWRHARELLWPSMGWRRAFRYWRLRIARLSDSTRRIALGLSIGGGMAFSPLIGTHFVQSAALAYLFRGNILGALIGNFIGNPWTYPFIWWASIKFGAYLVSVFGIATSTALPTHLDLHDLFHIMWHKPLRLFLPWMLGGHALGILFAIVSYPVFYRLIHAMQSARRQAKLYRIHQVAREVTESRSSGARH